MLKTAEILITNLQSDVNQTRVGHFRYQSIAEEVFSFDEYTNTVKMISVMNTHIR
ncbi:hypothetical protein DPMN_106094 [Dreissena polymorpha]|uniref:Uncharacterized protein n=1 Tax=Dreissena polymorpha TaxID=45954 RepID=A0A9D4QIE5_DREPO|nr:hypothetical protein DPMN_106094 [Dreissena polymorpha]